jgi:pyridoxamine 5'-phosphate oxidase
MEFKDISTDRIDYGQGKLDISDLAMNPIDQLAKWLEQAKQFGARDYNAFILGTLDGDGYPTTRVVLLRDCQDAGLTFYTNYESDKGRAMEGHNKVSANFFWADMERQVRVLGQVQRVSETESDEYFASRPRESQIGAWASQQSRALSDRSELEEAVRAITKEFEGREVTRPPHWGGFRIVPHTFEFWQGRSSRLHDRLVYSKAANHWDITRLNP